jgi:hypothetical protein
MKKIVFFLTFALTSLNLISQNDKKAFFHVVLLTTDRIVVLISTDLNQNDDPTYCVITPASHQELIQKTYDHIAQAKRTADSHVTLYTQGRYFSPDIDIRTPDVSNELKNFTVSSLSINNIQNEWDMQAILQLKPLQQTLENLRWCFCDKVSTKTLLDLMQFKKLKQLDLHCCSNIDDEALVAIASKSSTFLENLSYLNLNGTNISDKGVKAIAPHLKLCKDLSLCDTSITNNSFLELAKLKSLDWLDLRGCKNISLSGIQLLLNEHPSLEILF